MEKEHGDVLRIGYHEGASTNRTNTNQKDDDILVEEGPSRHSGRKIASAIVTPSRAQRTDHVTYRVKCESRAITFSPKEKETSKDDMDEGQMIEALQDMEMGEANSMEQENDGIVETDVLDEPTDDLLGEELEAMDVGNTSKELTAPKSTKERQTSKGSSRSLVPCGMHIRKTEFLRRESPRKYGVLSLGDTDRHSGLQKPRSSSHKSNKLEGSKKTPKTYQ